MLFGLSRVLRSYADIVIVPLGFAVRLRFRLRPVFGSNLADALSRTTIGHGPVLRIVVIVDWLIALTVAVLVDVHVAVLVSVTVVLVPDS